MSRKRLTEEQIKYIADNKGKMRPCDIAEHLKVSRSAIHQRMYVKKAKVIVMTGFFNVHARENWAI